MVQNIRLKIYLIVAIVLAALATLYFKEITLGLDLSGGSSLRYRLPRPADLPADKPMAEVVEQTLDVFRKRIQGSGLKEIPIRSQGDDEILIELPGMSEAEVNNIMDIIQSQGNLDWMMEAENETDNEDDSITIDVEDELKRLVAHLKTLESEQGGWDLETDLSPLNFSRTINGNLRYYRWYPMSKDVLRKEGIRIPEPGSTFEKLGLDPEAGFDAAPGQGIGTYFRLVKKYDDKKWQFTGKDLSGVSSSFDGNQNPAVGFEFLPARKADFSEFTRIHIKKPMAIILDSKFHSAPIIQDELRGSGVISGGGTSGFTQGEQKALLTVLRSGSLIVKPVLLSKNTIGPTLGNNAIYRGKIAAALGLSIVFVFLIAYYFFAGLIASISLAVNLTLLMGLLVFLEATLTLPGIAAIVLTVGMAVDANILIFERIREEKDKGKTLAQAVKNGFERAFITIVDANMTTFITGAILYWCGTGPIKGFALMLMFGICTSLFAALLVSKVIFAALLESGKLKSLNMLRLLKSPDFSFLKVMPAAATVSVIIVIASVVGFSLADDTKYGLDFTGGYNVHLKCIEGTTQKRVQTSLGAVFPNVQVVEIRKGLEGSAAEQVKSFAVKIKSTLSDEDALRIENEVLQTGQAEEGVGSAEDYLVKIKELLGEDLVKDPIYDMQLTRDEATQSVKATFGLDLVKPVGDEELIKAFGDLLDIETVDSENPLNVQISAVYKRGDTITPEQLMGQINSRLKMAKREEKSPIELLDPFPLTEYIGPTVGHQLRDAAIIAIIASLTAIILYIRLRFKEYKYGIAAATALVHDVLITLGAVTAARYSGLVDVEIDLPLIAAFLTIIGYSLNDTIVVFDRVRENLPRIEMPFAKLVNFSINQTLSRTILTSLTTLMTVVILFVLNYGQRNVMEGFSFALIVGIIVGTYSSIFVASPVLIRLHQREEKAQAAAK